MRNLLSKFVPIAATMIALLCLVRAGEVEADGIAYLGPAGWTRVDVASPTPTRTIVQWHIAGDPSSVTFIQDSTQSYTDSLAAMAKNFSDNGIKPVTKDIPCRGAMAHVIEFKAGPDGSQTIINRVILPVGTGIATITYTRADGNTFDDDVMKAEKAYCSSS
jgi:hypothetical protein